MYYIPVDTPSDGTGHPGAPRGAQSPAFLLAQVGALAAAGFAERLGALGLQPQHAGVLRLIAASPGVNQLTLGQTLGIFPSRLVTLIDQLEQRGTIERRRNPEDRRNSALYLTAEGRETLAAIGRVAIEHQNAFLAALSGEERERLAGLLQRLAAAHGLALGVHPGFRTL